MHGDIGYKFCWSLPHSRSTNWTWISWDTNWERIKWRRCRERCQLHIDIISGYLGFSSQVWWIFLHFLTLLVVSFTRLYFSIAFNLVLVNRTLFGSIAFVFLYFCFFFFVTVDTSCVCQSGYKIVEEGLLNLKHLITRSWNWAWTSWKLHLRISIVTMVIRTIPMNSDQWVTVCIHLVWVHHHV